MKIRPPYAEAAQEFVGAQPERFGRFDGLDATTLRKRLNMAYARLKEIEDYSRTRNLRLEFVIEVMKVMEGG